MYLWLQHWDSFAEFPDLSSFDGVHPSHAHANSLTLELVSKYKVSLTLYQSVITHIPIPISRYLNPQTYKKVPTYPIPISDYLHTPYL